MQAYEAVRNLGPSARQGGGPEQAQIDQRSVFGSLVNAFTNSPDVKGKFRKKYGR